MKRNFELKTIFKHKKRLGQNFLLNKDILEKIKYFDGNLDQINEIPEELRLKHKEAFGISPMTLLKHTAVRGKWIDQSQSHNIFMQGVSGKLLSEIYIAAWKLGLKTTYYLRSIAATTTEKSTINQGSLNAVSAQAEQVPEVPHELGAPAPVPEACSLDDPDCEACQ